MKALKISNLIKIYAPGRQVLNGISLEVEQGDFFALLGPNGAGKSTTIGIITSLVKKTQGKVSIFGLDMDIHPIKVKLLIGVVPQEYNFSQFESPLEILLNQGGFYGINRKESYQRAEKYLGEMGLWEQRHHLSRTLSGGFKRRLMIARALMSEPKLLFLDEPTAGVDVELRRSMWDFLMGINQQGTTIILTTHYLEEAENLCKNIAIIDRGSIVENTTVKSLLARMDIETFIIDLKQPQITKPKINCYNYSMPDPSILQVEVPKEQGLSNLFKQLAEQNIEILSMRNKTNRLEELFLKLTDKVLTND